MRILTMLVLASACALSGCIVVPVGGHGYYREPVYAAPGPCCYRHW